MAILIATPGARPPGGTAEADTIIGLPESDTLSGADGDDLIFGGGGGDDLIGSRGNDLLFGGPGNDRLFGQFAAATVPEETPNADFLTGGPGADQFFFGNGTGQSFIQDFNLAEGDKVALDYAVDGNRIDDFGELLLLLRSSGGTTDFPPPPEPGGAITPVLLAETFVVLDFGGGDVVTIIGADSLGSDMFAFGFDVGDVKSG
ncbi:MAG TPA: hypothetical protein VF342_07390 [Alphaproteobacteria bacterium]